MEFFRLHFRFFSIFSVCSCILVCFFVFMKKAKKAHSFSFSLSVCVFVFVSVFYPFNKDFILSAWLSDFFFIVVGCWFWYYTYITKWTNQNDKTKTKHRQYEWSLMVVDQTNFGIMKKMAPTNKQKTTIIKNNIQRLLHV